MGILRALTSRWSNLKLQTKLVTTFLVIGLCVILVITTIVGFSTKVFFVEYVHHQSEVRATQWRDYFEEYYSRNNQSWNGIQKLMSEPAIFQAKGFNRGLGPADRIILINGQGIVVADSEGNKTIGKAAPELASQNAAEIYLEHKYIGKVILGGSPPPGMVTLEQRFFQSVFKATIVASIIAIILAVSLAIQFSRRISIPLVSLTKAARKLAEKDYKYRLFIPAQDEIGTLAKAFNTMAEAIEKNELVRNHLVADIAHELRTPITILRGNLESLQAGVLEPSQEVIVSLHDELLRLSRLINDLQELTLAESGKLLLNYKQINAIELLKKIVNNFKGPATAKDIELKLSVPENEVWMEIDQDRIVQVLANIIGNAIRHTPSGKKIEVELVEIVDRICFTITDSGPGINTADIPYIFDRFYRGSKSRNRLDGGTGLGLAIAKSLVEAHGGSIGVHCPPGEGSIFTVCLQKKQKK